MEEARLQTLAQGKVFLDGTTKLAFQIPKAERNTFIERVLKRVGYSPHKRADKRMLPHYLERMTRLLRQQVTRLVRNYVNNGKLLKRTCPPRHGFTRRYTAADIALLAEIDIPHSTYPQLFPLKTATGLRITFKLECLNMRKLKTDHFTEEKALTENNPASL